MKVTFWGTRGSLPAPIGAKGVRAKVVGALVKASGRSFADAAAAEAFVDAELAFPEWGTFGGNSSCVQVDTGHAEYLLCDLGSGAREFAVSMMAKHGPGKPQVYNVLMSHLHWDHIMGFPFFIPGFIPGNRIRIHGCHAELEAAFRRQNAAPSFPVDFGQLGATIEFVTLTPGTPVEIAGATITPKLQLHSGDSYGYRIEQGGKSVVYSTDSEHKLEEVEHINGFVRFFKGADLVIFDAMYSLADAISVKEDWGHSSNVVAVELCQMAEVAHLCMFHHEPIFDDQRIHQILQETLRFEAITRGDHVLKVSTAYDGLTLEI